MQKIFDCRYLPTPPKMQFGGGEVAIYKNFTNKSFSHGEKSKCAFAHTDTYTEEELVLILLYISYCIVIVLTHITAHEF